jgi:hypothetical protein
MGGKGLGILRIGLEHPMSIKGEEMMTVQKNCENTLCQRIGYTLQAYFITPISELKSPS